MFYGAQRLLRNVRRLAIISVLLSSNGCQTVEGVPEGSPFAVVNEGAPFYIFGPAQAAPDASLTKGDRGMVLSREFGFSRVQLENGQIGFVDSDDIAPAPALAVASAAPATTPAGDGQPAARGESLAQPQDIPLPQDKPLPPSDEPSPGFRF